MSLSTTKKEKGYDIIIYIIIGLTLLFFIAPIWILFVASLSEEKGLTMNGYSMWFSGFSFRGYQYLFEACDVFVHSIFMSILVSVSTALLSLALTALAGYALSKPYLPFRSFFNLIFIIPMFFGGGQIPLYIVIRSIGIYDTAMALILPSVFSVYNLILVRKYFTGIDKAMEEAALIDGAGHWKIFVKIYLPLSVPICITVGFMVFVAKWNSWIDNVLYLGANSQDLWTMQYVLRMITTERQMFAGDVDAPQLTFQNAAVMASVIPIIVASPFLQKFFTKGITAGAVKG